MPDYREIQYDIEGSDFTESWPAASLTQIQSDPAVLAVIEAHEDWWNIAGAQFILSVDRSFSWYIRAGSLEETPFFFHFFRHPTVTDAIPGISPFEDMEQQTHLGFNREASWFSIARLATFIGGGPITGPSGLSDDRLVPLVRDFEQAAFRGVYSEALCYQSGGKWSPWFEGYRNLSLWMIDKANGLVTVLLITDAD